MINVRELNVGNLVFDEDLMPMYIAGVWPVNQGKQYRFIDSAGNTGNINLLQPIPLTEDILLKAGFEVTATDALLLPIYLVKGFDCYRIHLTDGDNGLDIQPIHYLHQLQNLHFSLVGEELTIEL